jgi:DNA-binding transcriptional ArsR family regulator
MGATAAAATVVVLWLVGSSGSVAGGATSASGLSKDLRRLLPFASPLFTRFEKETVLGHPKREALYALILQDPGVSLQSLCEATGLSRTAVTHHLRLMELQHIIVSKRVGRSRHYYENGGRFGREQKDAYAVLQNARSKQVADFVRANPGTIQKQLCDGLGIQASIAHWHVRRLRDAGLVEEVREGRTVRYLPSTALHQVAGNQAAPPSLAPAMAPPPSPGLGVPVTALST